jgi:hypothetical protein
MGPNTENDEILPTKMTELSDFDALEKQLNEVLGTLQEKVPTVEVKPEVPSFQLGATPLYSQTKVENTTHATESDTHEPKNDVPVTTPSQEFHTISGGPETLKEVIEKKAPVIHREHAQIVAGMYTKQAPAVYVEEKIFLSSALFFWFSAVTFIFFILGAGLPFIMELVVKYNYMILEGNVYRDGTISFPVALVDNMLLLTFQLTLTSIVVLIITGTIDYGIKKNFGDFTRAGIHGGIMIIYGYIIFTFCRDQGVTQEQVHEAFLVIKNVLSGVFGFTQTDSSSL